VSERSFIGDNLPEAHPQLSHDRARYFDPSASRSYSRTYSALSAAPNPQATSMRCRSATSENEGHRNSLGERGSLHALEILQHVVDSARGREVPTRHLAHELLEYARVSAAARERLGNVAMAKHRYGFVIANDPQRDFTGGGIFGPAFNTLARCDFTKGAITSFGLDSKTTAQEPVFVPRDCGPEGVGSLLVLVNRFETMLNDLPVFDAQAIESGPVATIKLPIRLRNAVHGNWVPQHLLDA
jgi:carotenoid cleavage dioxygenase-like enzyme